VTVDDTVVSSVPVGVVLADEVALTLLVVDAVEDNVLDADSEIDVVAEDMAVLL
jgi:hypothetical protein